MDLPTNTLWARDSQFPSTPAQELSLRGSEADRRTTSLVILIHGYNNSPQRARDSYEAFRAAIRAVLPKGADGRFGPIWELQWPGDLDKGGLSFATFPVKVPVARNVAQILVDDFIARLRPYQVVYIVAHSLGCRVALEAIARIRLRSERQEYSGPTVRAAFLLAAAVPITRCAGPQAWFPAPSPPSAEYVFHSRRDRALQIWFVPGQAGFGEEGPAVGRDGFPDDRWADRMDTSLGHKHYWGSRPVARRITELLGLRGVRSLAERPVPEEALADDVRQLEERQEPERQLRSRI